MSPDTILSAQLSLGVDDAYARYEAIRARLPEAQFAGTTQAAENLLAVAERYDGFVFDSFGVLNVGETAIPGAADCLSALRTRGRSICILTNAASYSGDAALAKYQNMGLDVQREEIVSSRDVALAQINRIAPGIRWGALAAKGDQFDDTDAEVLNLLDGDGDWGDVEGFLFLSSVRLTVALQDRLVDEVIRAPRPVVIANPDLVAPREGGLTVEPGWWGHDLWDRSGIAPRFYGKPYRDAFDTARSRLAGDRLAMVGDTLHTDILGGRAAGFGTILITDHGLFQGRDTAEFITDSGIVPDWTLPQI